jgi:hypothetical protein
MIDKDHVITNEEIEMATHNVGHLADDLTLFYLAQEEIAAQTGWDEKIVDILRATGFMLGRLGREDIYRARCADGSYESDEV